MHPDTIRADNLARVDEPLRYCIVLDEDSDLMIVPSSEASSAQVIGNRVFLDKRDAQQHRRVIEALADDLRKGDRLRAAAWLYESSLLS